MRRRLTAVLLLLILLITPVFANTGWTESKALGNIPHKELSATYLASMTKGNLEKKALPYPANLEMTVEYDEEGLHPLSYNLYLYENPHAYIPVTLKAKNNLVLTVSNDMGNSITLNIKNGYEDNRIQLRDMQALAFTEMMVGSRYVDIQVVDVRNVYTFRVDTRDYARSINRMLLSLGVSEKARYDLFTSERDIADFVARNMKLTVNSPAMTVESFENFLYFLMDKVDEEFMWTVADVLWERSYEDWINYFGSGYTDKAEKVLWYIDVTLNNAPQYVEPVYTEIVESEPVVEEVPVDEPIVDELVVEDVVEEEVVDEDPDSIIINELVIENLYIGDKEITGDCFQVPVAVPEDYAVVDEIVEVELVPEEPYVEEEPGEIGNSIKRSFFIGAKTYAMGANLKFGEEDTKLSFPLGGALDFTYIGRKHGVSVEAAYVYADKNHTIEPGISYIYRLQNNDKVDIDARLGFITNIQKLADKEYGYAFGGRLGIEMNFFATEKMFFNIGLHIRGLSPVIIFNEGVHMGNSWDLDFELGAGFGVAF